MTVKLYDSIAVNQGMILDLPFFEGIGGITHDISRYHNNVLFPGGVSNPTWTHLASGKWVLRFDGGPFGPPADTNDYTTITDNAIWALGQLDFSFEAWMYITGYNGAVLQCILRQALGGNGFGLYVGRDHFTFDALVGFVPYRIESPDLATMGFTLSTWHHVVMTRRNINTWRLFCDTREYVMTGAATNPNIPNIAADLSFGSGGFGPGGLTLWGRIGNPKFYLNHALTLDEIMRNYLDTRGYYL